MFKLQLNSGRLYRRKQKQNGRMFLVKNFALIGAGGYIAPKHMQAIKDTGNKLVAATDPNDSVGVMDRYFMDTAFFTEIERFDRHIEKLKRGSEENRVHFVSICSPNFLHDAHVRLALRTNCHAICEKPIVINPWNIDALIELESEYDRRVYNILQLRMHPTIQKLKADFESSAKGKKPEIHLSYITRRGPWYHSSWKGDEAKSGGIVMNIGVHFFDMLLWIYGGIEKNEVHVRDHNKVAGYMELVGANVRWFLSVDERDLPKSAIEKGQPAFRSITVDGQNIEFSDGFTDLHTVAYQGILSGNGFGLIEAKPAIEAVHKVRTADVAMKQERIHPMLK
jgi:UDP-N-acetyl-2-amino-2-deoxyglucuronate dehydrogenase